MPRGPVLTVIITSANEGLDKGLKDAEKKIGAFGAGAAGKAASIAKVAAPIAGVAAAVAKLGAAGDKANTDMALFTDAMTNAGVSAEALKGPIDTAIKSSKDLAFSTGETRAGLLALTRATGDSEKAVQLLSVAQDVARLAGTDLETASNAVAKAYAGQDRALRTLLPGLPATASGYDTIAAAEKAAAGQADIFAESAEATGIKTKAALKGIATTLGKAVAPAFNAMLDALLPVIEALGELLNAILPVLIPLVKALAKAFEIAAKAITKVINLVTKLINKIKSLFAPLDKAIDKLRELNPFGATMNNIVAGNAGTAAGLTTTRSGGGGGGGGTYTFNIYGDPAVIEARVLRALRGYQSRNGVGSVLAPGRS